MKIAAMTIALLATAGAMSTPADAAVFGIFGASTTQAAALVNQQAGNSAVVLAAITPTTLGAIDVLWVLNGSNGAQASALTNNADVASFVGNGGVLLYHDRAVTGAATSLPGGGAIAFTRATLDTVNVEKAVGLTGPGGTITDASLDNGDSSTHGYATIGSLPAGAVGILNNGTAGRLVDFEYRYGQGMVHYSSIPLDYYLAGSGPAAFRTIYAPNAIAHAASLADGAGEGAVPEPASWAMMLAGIGMVGFALRRRGKVSTTVAYA